MQSKVTGVEVAGFAPNAPNSAPSDHDLNRAINRVRVFHVGENKPEEKIVRFRPITLDFNGESFTFHPLGVRFEKRTSKRKVEHIDLEGNKVMSHSPVKVHEWVINRELPPVKAGDNGVDVPVEAYRFWRTKGSFAKLIEYTPMNQNGDPIGDTVILLKTEVQIAETIRAERDRLEMERAKQVAELEELRRAKEIMAAEIAALKVDRSAAKQ